MRVVAADLFSYTDPIKGTEGATLRVYLERLETDPDRFHDDAKVALAPIIATTDATAGIKARTGRDASQVIS